MSDELLAATLERDDGQREKKKDQLCLTILLHPDLARVGDVAYPLGRETLLSRATPGFGEHRGTLADPCLSRTPIVITALPRGGARVSPQPKSVAATLDGRPLAEAMDFDAAALARGTVIELADRVVLLLHRRGPFSDAPALFGIVGRSEAITQLREQVLRLADLRAPVLLRGESGVGKELVARAIHEASPRREQKCICVNMAAVSTATAAAELFGHTKGAYTGAAGARPGLFRQANGGTLFLDEIGVASIEVQAMLLRVLETGELQPLGDSPGARVDVRVVAATDEDLEGAIAEGRFRAPLYHRLGGLTLRVPPLRERCEDLGRLLVHFAREEMETMGELHRLDPPEAGKPPWLSSRLVGLLAKNTLSGNVRELRNLLRNFLVQNRGAERTHIDDDLARVLSGGDGAKKATGRSSARRAVPPAKIGDDQLVFALKKHKWKLTSVAEELGISRTSLYGLIERSPTVRKAKSLSAEEIEYCMAEHAGDADTLAEHLEVSSHGLRLRMKELGL